MGGAGECHKDRLLRFGSDLIFTLRYLGQKLRCATRRYANINRSSDSSFEEDLAKDVLEIITVFSARLYGSRSHKNKKLIEQLREVAQELK